MFVRRCATGLLTALALSAAAGPARAEGFLESIFGSSKSPAPADAASAAPSSAPLLPAAPQKPAAAARRTPAASSKPGQAASAQPATPDPAKKAPAGPAPAQTVAAAGGLPASPAQRQAGPLDDRTVLERANAYFNGISTLVGDFSQVGADGRKVGGKLYLARPGRLRFDYDEPSTLEVVADGSAVAVRDRKLNTQDAFFIKDTPLKFLLQDKIDLARDEDVKEVTSEPGGIRIVMEDRSTFRGTTRITLYFDPEVKTLSQWRIVDPQGIQTIVVLSNIERGRRLDAKLFVITY